MRVDHAMLVAKAEMRRRQEWAAEERLARQARNEHPEEGKAASPTKAGLFRLLRAALRLRPRGA